MKSKKVVFIFALIFAGTALYLCPCVSAAPSSEVVVTNAMTSDCCGEMPNCPVKGNTLGGIKSLLSSFNIVSLSFDAGLQYAYQVLGNAFYPSSYDAIVSLARSSLEATHQKSPTSPKLYIKFANLLI